MTIKTTHTSVSFAEPFTIGNIEEIQPPGEYIVIADDELIEGISRIAYRRVATLLQIPRISAPQTTSQLVSVSAAELDAAQMKDRHQTA